MSLAAVHASLVAVHSISPLPLLILPQKLIFGAEYPGDRYGVVTACKGVAGGVAGGVGGRCVGASLLQVFRAYIRRVLDFGGGKGGKGKCLLGRQSR